MRVPDGLAHDVVISCAEYEAAILEAGGVDLQILGIGSDGHIGFNEPGSSLASRTRIKTLTEQTRGDNARFFGGDIDQVPRHCLTQGLATIMSARHIVLIATGYAKAEAVHHLVEGPGVDQLRNELRPGRALCLSSAPLSPDRTRACTRLLPSMTTVDLCPKSA